MNDNTQQLFAGTPCFPGSAATKPTLLTDMLEAWTRQLSYGPAKAALNVEGPFSVAIRTEQGQTFMAIDRFGIHTLCYRVEGSTIRFAHRADELALDNDPLDPQAIFDYLYFHCIPSPRTIYKNVFRLPPGHYAWFDKGELTIEPYWKPEFHPQKDLQFESARSEFLHLLKTSVGNQLDGSKPACFLSGGTDSSTVAGMIREASGCTPSTYSIGFEADGYDEMAYARIAAKHFNTDHHEIYFTPDELVDSIPKVAAFYDQPFGNSSALPAYHCAEIAKQDGVKHLLAGDGGDELFGGNSRYAKQKVFGWWQSVPKTIRSGLLEPLCMNEWAKHTPLLMKAHSYVEQARVEMPGRLQMYNLLMRLGIHEMLTPDFLSKIDITAPTQHQQTVWNLNSGASELNATLAFDWRYTLGESDLPKVRETTKLAGLSVGFPMLDTRLLDFSLRLPDNYKLKGLRLRWFFKEALRGFLPDEILRKKKQGFGLPFGVWMTQKPRLRQIAQDSLRTLGERGIVRPEFIEELLTLRLPEHPGYYGEQVWILMMLEQWLRAKHSDFKLNQ